MKRIFISSVQKEFERERAAIKRMIENAVSFVMGRTNHEVGEPRDGAALNWAGYVERSGNGR